MARLLSSLLLTAVLCSGCFPLPEKSELDEKKKEQPKLSLAADLDKLLGDKQPKVQEQRVAAKRGNLGVLTNRLYNHRVIITLRPKLKVRTKATGGTALTSAALSITSQAGKAHFDGMIQQMRTEIPRGSPKYDAVVKRMSTSGFKLAKLTPYQVYAYDEQTGQLFILEDTEMQAKLYAR